MASLVEVNRLAAESFVRAAAGLRQLSLAAAQQAVTAAASAPRPARPAIDPAAVARAVERALDRKLAPGLIKVLKKELEAK